MTENEQPITEELVDGTDPIIDVDEEYTFTISEKTTPDYRMTYTIIKWLQEELENLTDDDDHTIFSKVNCGFSESSLKSYGKKPVCDVYLDRVEYDGDFDNHIPMNAYTFIIFHMKGANNPNYLKACSLHDYLMQELITNESLRTLPNIVKDTHIENSEIRIQPVNKKWGIIGAFKLKHKLY